MRGGARSSGVLLHVTSLPSGQARRGGLPVRRLARRGGPGVVAAAAAPHPRRATAPRTPRARRSPATRGCSRLPARPLRRRRGRRGAPKGAWLDEWVALRRRRRAQGADAFPARVAGAEAIRQRARHPPDRRHPSLRRGRLVRRVHASGALRPLRRRGRGAIAQPSRGAALGDARLRLARPRGRRIRLVARAHRARARAVRPAPHRPLPRPRQVLEAAARRAGSGEGLLGRRARDGVLRGGARARRRAAVHPRGSRVHHPGRRRAAGPRSACRA